MVSLAFWACNNPNTSQQTAESSDRAITPTNVATEETTLSSNGEALEITAPEILAKRGETVCMDLLVKGFDRLLSMQYTLTWNKNILAFKELKSFKLPYLDLNDFGTNHTQDGTLTVAWIDESLKGASLPDGSAVYQVCFDVKGKSGESSYFKITDRPTSIEVVNLREKVIPLKKKNGKVTVL